MFNTKDEGLEDELVYTNKTSNCCGVRGIKKNGESWCPSCDKKDTLFPYKPFEKSNIKPGYIYE